MSKKYVPPPPDTRALPLLSSEQKAATMEDIEVWKATHLPVIEGVYSKIIVEVIKRFKLDTSDPSLGWLDDKLKIEIY